MFGGPKRFLHRTDSSQLPRLPECLKSAINSDSAFLASGHQGMRKNSYRVCWSLYGFNVFSGGGHPHYVVTGNFHDYYLSKENN